MKCSRICAPLSLLLLAWCSIGTAAAQAPIEPSSLSARTLFYLVWRGMPSGEVRKANSLFAIWDDPGFAPVRDALAESLFDNPKDKTSAPKMTRADWEEYAPLLDNAYVLGYLNPPHKAAAATPSAEKKPDWDGFFFVYDRSGKETLLAKALLRIGSKGKEQSVSDLTVAGLPATKVTSKTGATYFVNKGKYLISAGELSVAEDILARLNDKAPGSSLSESAAFQEAQPLLGKGTLEFFLRIPDLKELAPEAPQQGFKVKPILDALRIDAIHSLSGHVTFEGEKTHVQGAILGDTSAGTLFDIFADGQPSPAALAFASSDTVYFSSTQMNFAGIYATIKRAVRAALPPGQQTNADMLDVIAQTRIGMPVSDLLSLLSGEFASIQSSPKMDVDKQVYYLGIRNKPQVLKLIHTLFGDQVTGEHSEGDATFLRVSRGAGPGASAAAQGDIYNVAVTSDAVLGATRLETLRQILSERAQNGTGGFASSPQFQAARAHFPQAIDAINYADFKKFDWPGLKDHWLRELKKGTPAAKSLNGQAAPSASPKSPAQLSLSWLENVDPQVFARHLHSAFAASWKDGKGFHFEQWLD